MNTIVLDKPSKLSHQLAHKRTQECVAPPTGQKKTLKQLKKSFGIGESDQVSRKLKRMKGPNPMSCKKKKKNKLMESSEKKPSRRKRHTRKRNKGVVSQQGTENNSLHGQS